MTLLTTLTPLNSETYNSSFTMVNYAPAGKSELKSLKFVEFNIPVTLSQHYVILGKVAEEVAKVYEKTKNEIFLSLAKSNYTITVCSMILKLLLIARLGVLGASWPPRSLILHAGYA
jgi:hypothetical protein